MRTPQNDERALAAILLEKAKLNTEAREVLERVERGEMVHHDALILLRQMGGSYISARFFEKSTAAN
jgi:hypothetical protein